MSDKEDQEPESEATPETESVQGEPILPESGTPAPEPHAAVAEEVKQVQQLWNEYGQQTAVAIVVAVVLAGAWTWYRNHRADAEREAQQALFRSRSATDLQTYVERYPRMRTAPLAALMLAHTHYAAGKYADALTAYESFIRDHAKHQLLPVAELGRAHALEGLGRFDDAIKDFDAFLGKHKEHFLTPEAQFGKARCLHQMNRLDEARVIYENFIAANPGSDLKPRAEEWLKRVDKAIRAGGWKPAAAAMPAMPSITAPDALSLPPVTPPAATSATNKP